MKQSFIATILALFSIGVFGQKNACIDSLFFESRSDSLDLANNFYDLFDSLTKKIYPANEFYVNWNTHTIRYQEGDTVNKTDSVELILLNPINDEQFVIPFKGNVTSGFGYRRSRFHYGTDIDLKTGDSVVAAFNGMVRISTYDRSFGNVIVIRHSNGLETVYAHLLKILVDSNSTVKAGDLIGYGGNTGRSTGSHLHFEVRYLGAALNPATLVDFTNHNLIADTVWLTKKNFEYLHQIAADKNAKYHSVRKGDTLSAIARKYGTSVGKICYLNGIKETKVLQIGEKIRVR